MPDKHEVGGSSPLGPTTYLSVRQWRNSKFPIIWGCSSVGRAPALQAGGHGFESHHLHHEIANISKNFINKQYERANKPQGLLFKKKIL